MSGEHSTTPTSAPAAGKYSRELRGVDELGGLLAEVDGVLAAETIAAYLARRTRLVLEELVTNAFRHGGAESVAVDLRVGAGPPKGSVSYAGPAFDPTAPRPRAANAEVRVGGQGLPLIRSLAGKLRYSRRGDVNRVEFEISTVDG